MTCRSIRGQRIVQCARNLFIRMHTYVHRSQRIKVTDNKITVTNTQSERRPASTVQRPASSTNLQHQHVVSVCRADLRQR